MGVETVVPRMFIELLAVAAVKNSSIVLVVCPTCGAYLQKRTESK